MTLLLPTIIGDRAKFTATHPLVILQSSAAQTALPILQSLLRTWSKKDVVLVCTLYSPQTLLAGNDISSNANMHIIDWTANVPGYGIVDWDTRLEDVKGAIDKCQTGQTAVVIDSVDTLDDDYELSHKTYAFLSRIQAHLRARRVLHITLESRILPLLKQPSFSTSIAHISAYPPALLTYIASTYLTSPPSSETPSNDPSSLKFWSVFLPFVEPSRARDVEALVVGVRDHPAAQSDEIVVEVLVRSQGGEASSIGGSSAALAGGPRRRAVERVLEGYSLTHGPCKLEDLGSIKNLWRQTGITEGEAIDPTKNLSFNLTLTSSQQASRAKVPLPYEHEGLTSDTTRLQPSQIFYDPDSADDMDDEDPDEDLDL